MPGDQINPDKIQKTGALISFGNLLMSPFYSKLGPITSLTLTAVALYGLHEIGRNKQSGHGFWGFFSSKTNTAAADLNSTMKNMAEGGSIVFDRLFPPGKK